MGVVIKLGGSVATIKDKPYAANARMLREYARLFKRLMENGIDALLVLGGGSFGHYEVARCRGMQLDPRTTVSRVSRAMNVLALITSKIFEDEGVPTLIYPPHAFCKPRGLKPGCDWGMVKTGLDAGLVPLTYGDIIGFKGSYHIISGDELAAEAACSLGFRTVVYATDVPGVFIGGRVVEKLDASSLSRLAVMVGGSGKLDVTGGMRRKLEAILAAGCRGLRAYILDGRDPRIVEDVILGGVRRGTLIEL